MGCETSPSTRTRLPFCSVVPASPKPPPEMTTATAGGGVRGGGPSESLSFACGAARSPAASEPRRAPSLAAVLIVGAMSTTRPPPAPLGLGFGGGVGDITGCMLPARRPVPE